MFPVTITLHDTAQLNAVMAALAGKPAPVAAEPAPAPKPKAEKTATPAPKAEPAPSQPTAEVAQPPAAAPATQTTATPAPAAATSAPVAYADLQKAVLSLHKMDPTAAIPIAKSLGADTFKLLPEAKWGEALAAVNAAIEARKAG